MRPHRTRRLTSDGIRTVYVRRLCSQIGLLRLLFVIWCRCVGTFFFFFLSSRVVFRPYRIPAVKRDDDPTVAFDESRTFFARESMKFLFFFFLNSHEYLRFSSTINENVWSGRAKKLLSLRSSRITSPTV